MRPKQIFGKNPGKDKVAYNKVKDMDCVVFYVRMRKKGHIAILHDKKGYSVMQCIAGNFLWEYTDDTARLRAITDKGGYGPFSVDFWEDTGLMMKLRELLILHAL